MHNESGFLRGRNFLFKCPHFLACKGFDLKYPICVIYYYYYYYFLSLGGYCFEIISLPYAML